MRKIWDSIAKDLWVVLLDVVAVNAAYYLALLIRFYVNFQLRPIAVSNYLPAWQTFTPWYTVICLVIFVAFKLYGGMWRYAGINDMNRIIGANLVTTVVHVIGTVCFVRRMPITYHIIGALLQFAFVVSIRFGYRVLLVEKRKIGNRNVQRIEAVVVGVGENGRRVVKSLEESDVYRPVAVVGKGAGTMDGLPIISIAEMPTDKVIFIADPLLSAIDREKIKATYAEVHEYTGFFSNLGGRLSLTELLAVIHTPLTVVIDRKDKPFSSGEDAIRNLTEKYSVDEVGGTDIRISLSPQKPLDKQEVLKQAYAAVLGEEKL